MVAGMDVVTLVSVVFAVAGGAVGVWQKIKAGQAAQAYDEAQATLAAIAVAVESVPMDELERGRLKRRIKDLAVLMETEEKVLAPVVAEVTALAKDIMEKQDGMRLTKVQQAEAVSAWKAARGPKYRGGASIHGAAPMVLVLGLLLCGGCTHRANLVEAQVVESDGDLPTLVMVAWPDGASEDPADYVTVRTMDGVMITTAPLVGSAPD